jgi:hypothetical protein
MIRAYFGGVGNITKNGENAIQYRVKSVKDLRVIVDHFDGYPLITQKRADYLLFKSIVELCNQKEHLTQDGLYKIVSLRAAMNNGLSDEQKSAFPGLNPVPRPKVVEQEIKNPHWLAGFSPPP